MWITGWQLICRNANLEHVYSIITSVCLCRYFQEMKCVSGARAIMKREFCLYFCLFLMRIIFHDNAVEHVNSMRNIPAHSREAVIDSQYTCCALGVGKYEMFAHPHVCLFVWEILVIMSEGKYYFIWQNNRRQIKIFRHIYH